jgi:hypothetical protein
VVVTVNGITQNHPANYSTNDTVLTFTDPPAVSSVIRVLQQAMIGTSIVPIDGSVTTSKLASGLTLSGTTTLSGNLTFSGTSNRIRGLLSGTDVASRVLFQTSTTDGNTLIGAIPNGTGNSAFLELNNASDPTNSSNMRMGLDASATYLQAGIRGTGTYLPLTMWTGGSEKLRIDTSGRLGIGTASPISRLHSYVNTNNGTIGVGAILDAGTQNPSVSGGGVVMNFLTNSGTSYYGAVGGYTDGTNYVTGLWGGAAASGVPPLSVNSIGQIGIGTTTPNTLLTLNFNSSAITGLQAAPAGGLSIIGTTSCGITFDTFTTNSQITFRRANGTITSPTALLTGNIIGAITGRGYGSTGWSGANRGLIQLVAEENWTDAAQGTYWQFNTVTAGTASSTEKMRISSAGDLGIGTTPYYSHKLAVAGTTVTQGLYINSTIGGFQTGLVNDGGNSSTSKALTITSAAGTELQVNYYGGHSKFFSTIGVGNIAGSTSGAGITFPATQSASSDANTLDDYEEGTWTPTISGDGSVFAGTTYTARQGNYVKIGRQVTVMFDISVSVVGTRAGNASVSGLPFPIQNTGDLSGGGGSLGLCQNLASAFVYQSIYPQNNSSFLYILAKTGAGSDSFILSSSSFYQNNTRITGSVTYITTT